MHFTGQVYRHPIEGNTQLLEVTAGCSHNKCSFCTMYKETKFCVSPLNHVEEDLQEIKSYYPNCKRIFLVNGEPFILATAKLVEIANLIKKYLPQVEVITCYASIKSIKNKSLEDLELLHFLGYDELHVGLESMYEPALIQMNKGCTKQEAYDSIEKLSKANIKWDAIIMTGVAGKGNGQIHINETVELLNKFPPYLLSIMTTSIAEGTPLATMRDNKEFIECSEKEKILEEISLLEKITFSDCYFFGGHNYNLIPVNAPLSKKQEIINTIKEYMETIDPNILNGILKRDNI